MNTHVYVDAFNLYYGSLKGTAYKWLNLVQFLSLSFPSNKINHVHYFTAKVKASRVLKNVESQAFSSAFPSLVRNEHSLLLVNRSALRP